MATSVQTVAVIGAGIGGLACARQLQAAGFRVRVFDKGRGVGGRVSVRRTEDGGQFDHGAQYFTVKDPAMACQVEEWVSAKVVMPWEARIGSLNAGQWTAAHSETIRYVGVPNMSAIAKHLAKELKIDLQTQVAQVVRKAGHWQLTDSDGRDLGRYAALVLNAPAPQSAALISDFPEFAVKIRPAEIAPCWAVLLAFEHPLAVPWDAAFVEESPLAWIARNSSKPGRKTDRDCWVLHANPRWSSEHLEASQVVVRDQLLEAFWEALAMTARPHVFADAHRWRFALPTEPLTDRCLFDRDLRLGACGDWCGGPRVEGAYLSGLALAEAITTHPRSI